MKETPQEQFPAGDQRKVMTSLLDRFVGTIKYTIHLINDDGTPDWARGIAEVTRNKKYITLCCDHSKKPRKPREVKSSLIVWDLKNHVWLKLNPKDILEIEFLSFHEHVTDPTLTHEICPFDLLSTPSLEDVFDEYAYACCEVDRVKRCDTSNVECSDYELGKILKAINMTTQAALDLEPDLEEKILEPVREMWMDKIRIFRDRALKELDVLEKETKAEGGEEDDLEDVNTIKQMFRDIPGEINLEEFADIESLLDFWPSLLLPHPGLDVVLEAE